MFNALGSFITSGSGTNLLLAMVALPAVLAAVILLIPKRNSALRSLIFILACIIDLLCAISLYIGEDMSMIIPWAGLEINLAMRLYPFSKLMLLAAASFAFLVGLYSISFMRGKQTGGQFFFYYLLSLALANGAFLANNMVVMLFFWEGLLITLFGMVIAGNKEKTAAAVKALVVNGIADLLLMMGIAITCIQTGTMMMDVISNVPLEGIGTVGFICMFLGAAGKAAAIPFHSWLPDASKQTPAPFLAIMPAVLCKLLGVYLLVRMSVNFFDIRPGSSMSTMMMIIGALTVVLAIGMTLVQKDFKRILAYHTIGQTGYIVLAIGAATPVGIIGGLFYMLNCSAGNCCLFLTAGAVEKEAGITDLRKAGGLGRYMPITAICFLIAALSICCIPPFGGFFSQELVFTAAMQSGTVYLVAAFLGLFLTLISFLKLGHSIFFGNSRFADETEKDSVKECPGAMLLPMLILAGSCVFLGVANSSPLSVIQPLLGGKAAGLNYAGWPSSHILVIITAGVLLLAILSHYIGCRKTGEAFKAADHITHLPVLRQLYNIAKKHYLDPYNIITVIFKVLAFICHCLERCINWLLDTLIAGVISSAAAALHNFNTGSSRKYVFWTMVGLALLLLLVLILM